MKLINIKKAFEELEKNQRDRFLLWLCEHPLVERINYTPALRAKIHNEIIGKPEEDKPEIREDNQKPDLKEKVVKEIKTPEKKKEDDKTEGVINN